MKVIKTQGVDIPRLGFGTFRMPGGESHPVVQSAIPLGSAIRPPCTKTKPPSARRSQPRA
jgi:hypothetical protein